MKQAPIENNLFCQTNTLSKHLLVFMLGKEEYAVDISMVQGIRNYLITTTISNCPEYIKGVTKVENDFALVIDLRLLLHITPATYNDFTLMILLNINGHLFSIVIDEVLDVLALNENEIKPATELSALVAKHYIQGVINHGDRLLILLDIEKLFAQDLLQLAKQAASE